MTCAESSLEPETWRTPWPAAGRNRPAARRTIRKDRPRRKPSRPGGTARTDALGVATRASRELRLERVRTRRRVGRRRGAMVPEENERTGERRPVEIEITPPRDSDSFRRPPEIALDDRGRRVRSLQRTVPEHRNQTEPPSKGGGSRFLCRKAGRKEARNSSARASRGPAFYVSARFVSFADQPLIHPAAASLPSSASWIASACAPA